MRWISCLLVPITSIGLGACRRSCDGDACTCNCTCGCPPSDDTGPDTGETGETGETGDTGDTDYLDGGAWVWAKSTPAGSGYTWNLDEDFHLPGYTVPSLLVLHGGAGYRMFLTSQLDRGSIYLARSADGLSWTVDPVAILRPDDFAGACGPELLDVSQVYLPDGSYRLLVEGYDQPRNVSTLCSAWSADGDSWAAEEGVRYAGSEEDCGTTSVAGVVWYRPLAAWLVFYVGDWCSPDGNAVRAAISTDGWNFEPWITTNILPQHRVDPEPVLIDGADGLRLYHSIWQRGHPGLAESPDAVTFTDLGDLPNLDDNSYHGGETPQPGDACMFDPSYLRLPDGRAFLYFSYFETDGAGQTSAGIRRASADDVAAP